MALVVLANHRKTLEIKDFALFVYMVKRRVTRKELMRYFNLAEWQLYGLLDRHSLYENQRTAKEKPTKEYIEELISQRHTLASASRESKFNTSMLRLSAIKYGLSFYKPPVSEVFCFICKKQISISKEASSRERSRFQDRKKEFIHGRRVSCSDSCHHKLRSIISIENLQNGKKEGTSIEVAIRNVLDTLEISYTAQKRVGYTSCDFYLNDSMVIIECQGTFHHADPRVYDYDNLSPIQRKVTGRDKSKKSYLERRGYALLVLWQNEIDNDIPWCTQQIIDAHESRKTAAADMSLFCAAL